MEYSLVAEGLKFMVLGMSVVFLFLVFMVLILEVQSRIMTKYFPDPQKPRCSVPSKNDNKDIVAAITAAIIHHRK